MRKISDSLMHLRAAIIKFMSKSRYEMDDEEAEEGF